MKRRSTRVWALSIAIYALSMLDLYLTLLYVRPGYFAELNPVGVWAMGYGTSALILVKVAMTLLALAILISARRRLDSEIASWLCLGVMLALTVHWVSILQLTH